MDKNTDWKTLMSFDKETTLIIFPHYAEFEDNDDVVWIADDYDGFYVKTVGQNPISVDCPGFFRIMELETFKNTVLKEYIDNDFDQDYHEINNIPIVKLKGDIKINYTAYLEDEKTKIVCNEFIVNYRRYESIPQQVHDHLKKTMPNIGWEGYTTLLLPSDTQIKEYPKDIEIDFFNNRNEFYNTKIILIDSCEYIFVSIGKSFTLNHKGNCKFCVLRQNHITTNKR